MIIHKKNTKGVTMHNLVDLLTLLLSSTLLIFCTATQQTNLHMLLKSTRSHSFSVTDSSPGERDYASVFVGPQDGLMEADKIAQLPGQPDNVDFDQYAGYVTVDPQAGRALFYYFVESPSNSSTKPLVLWLNGGPGCSSFGYGAMEELGPFRVNSDGKTLFRNIYAWNNVANVIFLESPAGVGFSYSNTTADYNNTGDTSTARDAYAFLVNWLERFPQYKTRDFYITGESYAGHYVPQLANIILRRNNSTSSQTVINLKGVAIGNALIDGKTMVEGYYDHLWTHALISDETHSNIFKFCDFSYNSASDECYRSKMKSFDEMGYIDELNIYAPICLKDELKNGSSSSINEYDPCSDTYVEYYLNTPQVQSALHAKPTAWQFCRFSYTYYWNDSQRNVLPTIKNLMDSGLRVWLYSGDTDANVPVTATKYAIKKLKLPIKTAWRPWYLDNEVGGYVVGYQGLTFATVRGAGHAVPSYQPQRALLLISSFLQGILPPS